MLVTACTRIARTLEQFIFFGFPMADKWLKKKWVQLYFTVSLLSYTHYIITIVITVNYA